MEKLNAEKTPEYREVQARELVWHPDQLDGQRIVLMDYLDGRCKRVETPELLTLGLDTSKSPGAAKQLETLDKRLYPVRLWGVFRVQGASPFRSLSLEVHSIEFLPEPQYLKVTWKDVYGNPQKYDRARVEYTGQYVSSFENSSLDGVWLEYSPYVIRRGDVHWQDLPGWRKGTQVRVRGVLHTQPGTYGHMGRSLFLLRADEIDFM